MNIPELLLPEFDAEMKTTRAVLERVPEEKGEWQAHPKAWKLGHLAKLVAMLPGWTVMTMKQTELDLAPKDGPKTAVYTLEKTATLLEMFDKGAKEGRQSIADAKPDDWNVPWTLKRTGETVLTLPRYMIYRQFTMNHIVHHRAQLAMYLRILDLKVPSMYGPTADDKSP
jgi:uncharacterized damage-inducible protein DinB